MNFKSGLPETYYNVVVSRAVITVDQAAKNEIEATLTSDVQWIYIKDLFGAQHIIKQSDVTQISESTPESRTLAALYDLKRRAEQAQILKSLANGPVQS